MVGWPGRGGAGGAAPRRVRKLEDDYFEDWAAGTELGREGFKRIMSVELRRREAPGEREREKETPERKKVTDRQTDRQTDR